MADDAEVERFVQMARASYIDALRLTDPLRPWPLLADIQRYGTGLVVQFLNHGISSDPALAVTARQLGHFYPSVVLEEDDKATPLLRAAASGTSAPRSRRGRAVLRPNPPPPAVPRWTPPALQPTGHVDDDLEMLIGGITDTEMTRRAGSLAEILNGLALGGGSHRQANLVASAKRDACCQAWVNPWGHIVVIAMSIRMPDYALGSLCTFGYRVDALIEDEGDDALREDILYEFVDDQIEILIEHEDEIEDWLAQRSSPSALEHLAVQSPGDFIAGDVANVLNAVAMWSSR